jgi:hypothetical protein
MSIWQIIFGRNEVDIELAPTQQPISYGIYDQDRPYA